jgi:hypothetical protein
MCVDCDLTLDRCKIQPDCPDCLWLVLEKVNRLHQRGETPGVRLALRTFHFPCPGGTCVEWEFVRVRWAPRTHHSFPVPMKVGVLAVLLCMVRRNNQNNLVLPPEVVTTHILPISMNV